MQTQPQKGGQPVGGFDIKPIAILAGLALVVALGFFMQYHLFPDGLLPKAAKSSETAVAEISPITDIHISEVMTSNKTALRDATGAHPDWVELTNVGNSAISLSGWTITDKASGSAHFTFPDIRLNPGEYLVVFASNRLQNEAGGEYHAPFKLSSSGDTLLLFDSTGSAVESINLPALGADQCYALADGGQGWRITSEYTPGLPNTSDNHRLLTDRTPDYQVALFINELVADNKTGLTDADGEYSDWIEIANVGGAPIALKGYALTDDPDDLDKWLFPDVTIGPGEYLVVFASGKESTADQLHASFRLSAEGEQLTLLDAEGNILGQLEFDNLKPNTALIRNAGGDYSVTGSPTPGENNAG